MLASLFWLSCIALALYSAFDVLLTDPRYIDMRSRGYWFVIVLLPFIGGLAWLHSGRPRGGGRRPGSAGAPGATDARGSAGSVAMPLGPEDDPDFMRHLSEQLRRGDR